MSAARRLAAEDRRRSITEAARALFARNGFDATTTRQLAEAAGVSDALLYRHFTDKRALLDQVVDDAMSVFSALPPLERLEHLPLDQLLHTLGTGFLDRAEVNSDLLAVLITEHRSIDNPRFAAFIHDAATALGNELAGRLPQLHPRNGYLAARSFFGSLVAFVILQRMLGLDQIAAIETASYLNQLVATTSAGLACSPPQTPPA